MALKGRASWVQHCIAVSDLSQVGEARRAVELEAKLADFDATQRARAAIVATEIATNIARHTRGGEVVYGMVEAPGGPAMEILGIDRGPGMADPDRCLGDGYSTRSTPGNGLGAIRRQSEEFDLHSSVERGSVVLARMHAGKPDRGAALPPLRFGGVCIAYPGEPVCGDAWRIRWNEDGYALMVVDGLGHGLLANEAAEAAAETFEASPFLPPVEMVERIHQRLHNTRGATAAIARFDSGRERLSYSGIGNISGRLLSDAGARGLISVNGTAGGSVSRIQQFEYEHPAGATLVMHSDGLQSRWDPDADPGLARRHPAILAGALYRDHQRGRDDVSVVAVQWSRTAGRGGA